MNKKNIIIGLGIVIVITLMCLLGTIIVKHISTKTSSETGGKSQIVTLGEKVENEENDKKQTDDKLAENTTNNTEEIKVQEKIEKTKEEISSNTTTEQPTIQTQSNNVKSVTTNKDNTKTSANTTNVKKESQTETQVQVKEQEQPISNNQSQTQNESSNQVQEKESTQPAETKTEDKQNTVENKPVTCTNNNNHFIEVGNSNRWFSSQKEAIAYYDGLVHEWSEKWESDEIDSKTYYKNCPYGYEVWSCGLCGKWTINLYYR